LDYEYQRQLWYPFRRIVPPQYAIFDVAGRPATIFSFNLDGLAKRYCHGQGIEVLEPHGSIDPEYQELDNQDDLIISISGGVALPPLRDRHPLGPEPVGFTKNEAYEKAYARFIQSTSLVVVGYSFGKSLDSFDDAQSFEFFMDLLKSHPRPAFVLSPDPSEIVDLFQQRLRSKDVYGLPIRWEAFAAALLAEFLTDQRRPFRGEDGLKRFQRAYGRALDQEGMRGTAVQIRPLFFNVSIGL
jgi:hypothetical protein